MAPESLRKKVYTHKSDVWSYGVTVWEVLTFGARPYGSKGVRELVKGVEAGERLEQPTTCTIEVYAVLLECKYLTHTHMHTHTHTHTYIHTSCMHAVTRMSHTSDVSHNICVYVNKSH